METRTALQIGYAIGAVAGISLVLARFAAIIQPLLAVAYDSRFELVMVVGQVLFQWCFLARAPFAVKWRYALLVLTISLMGAVLLLPLVAFHHFQAVPIPAALVYFFGVVGIMFAAHWWRIKVMELPAYLTWTWVLYRCILLAFIVKWP